MMILELFSGAGGLSLGFRRAGLPPTLVVDSSPDACESYARNFGVEPLAVDVRHLLAFVRHLHGWIDIDLLIADPPCTPWSRAGKREGQADPRDMLSPTVELVRALQPKAFLICNIPGLDDGPNLHTVHSTIGSLAGYCVNQASLDAADYGVPQHRKRPFWYGHHKSRDLKCVSWPAVTHGPPTRNVAMTWGELSPHVTCAEALSVLSPGEVGEPVTMRTATRLRGEPPRAGSIRVDPKHPTHKANAPAHTLRAGRRGGPQNCLEPWPWSSRPATTILSDEILWPPGKHPRRFARQTPGTVRLSEAAAAILQGFPRGWHFAGKSKRARWEQIGQALPPPLAEAVARAIADALKLDPRIEDLGSAAS